MRKYLGSSISIGLTGAAWAFIAEKAGLPAWITFVGWSVFFFSGADFEACKKTFPCMILGAVLAYIAVFAQISLETKGITSALIVFVLAFAMTIAQSLPIFSAASATFIGCAIYFGTGNLFHAIVLTSVGLILGIISITIARILDSAILKEEKLTAAKF